MNILTGFISHGKVLRTFDVFSNDAYSSVCTADIDNDGKYELLSLYGWGSGVWRMQITVYKYGNPLEFDSLFEVVYAAYVNAWYPSQFSVLKMVQINDTQVKLYGTDIDENGEIRLSEDYGLLRWDGNKLVPTNKEKFPFSEDLNKNQ